MIKFIEMDSLSTDFKKVVKKDKRFLVWMIGVFLISCVLFVLPILNTSTIRPKIIAGYSDISSGYWRSDWWYLTSFSVIALSVGVGPNLLSVLIHERYGKDVARLFLGISIAVVVFAIAFLLRIVEEG